MLIIIWLKSGSSKNNQHEKLAIARAKKRQMKFFAQVRMINNFVTFVKYFKYFWRKSNLSTFKVKKIKTNLVQWHYYYVLSYIPETSFLQKNSFHCPNKTGGFSKVIVIIIFRVLLYVSLYFWTGVCLMQLIMLKFSISIYQTIFWILHQILWQFFCSLCIQL